MTRNSLGMASLKRITKIKSDIFGVFYEGAHYPFLNCHVHDLQSNHTGLYNFKRAKLKTF